MCKIIKSAQRLLSASFSAFPSRRFASQRYIGQLEMFQRRLIAEEIGHKFELSDDTLTDVANRMFKAMQVTSTVKNSQTRIVFPTDADVRKKSTAFDKYLSLDMSDGENIRTRFTTVSESDDVTFRSRVYSLPRRMISTDGDILIDRASSCLIDFTRSLRMRTDDIPLVFTFGFPVYRNALDSAIMYRSTKEYDCADLEGHDVVFRLRQSLSRDRVRTGPVTILNDASAILLENGANDLTARVSVLVDNGCNCCYVDSRNNTIINTEWGAFGEDGTLCSVTTKYDIGLNDRSRQPGNQIFEKMTSGMYMGELVRNMMLEMAERNAVFDGRVTSQMHVPYALTGEHIAAAESDRRLRYSGGRAVLGRAFGVADPTDFDCELFRYACRCVSGRSACLVAAGLAGVLRLMKSRARGAARIPRTITVAAGGSVFRWHPKYASLVRNKTRTLTADGGGGGGGGIDFALRVTDTNGILTTKPVVVTEPVDIN